MTASLCPRHLCFLDVDEIHADLVEHKNEMCYFNLTIPRSAVSSPVEHTDWYRLQTPPGSTDFDHAGRIAEWQEIAKALLRAYASRYYEYRRAEYESQYLHYRPIQDSDGGLLAESVTAYLPRRPGSDEVADPGLEAAVERIRAMVERRLARSSRQTTPAVQERHVEHPGIGHEEQAGVRGAKRPLHG